jgi:hypothetical protein
MSDLNDKHIAVLRKAASAVKDRGHEGDARLADSVLGIVASLTAGRAPAAAPAPVAIKTWQERAGRPADCSPKPYAYGWYWEHALAEIADLRAALAAVPAAAPIVQPVGDDRAEYEAFVSAHRAQVLADKPDADEHMILWHADRHWNGKPGAMWRSRAALQAPVVQAEPRRSTDLSRKLREAATGGKLCYSNVSNFMLHAAADEIERYYGGMLNWKSTAETKDAAHTSTAADAKDASLEPERVFDIASKFFGWNSNEGWRKATQGTVNMVGLLSFAKEIRAAIATSADEVKS